MTKERSDNQSKPKRVILRNTERHGLVVPVQANEGDAEQRHFRIEPGINARVDMDLWPVAKANSLIKNAIDADRLIVYERFDQIDQYSVESILNGCADIESIRIWEGAEKRKNVKEKLRGWIAQLEEKFARNREKMSGDSRASVRI